MTLSPGDPAPPHGLDPAAAAAAETYTAAADHFDRPALSFWNRWGAETVSRIALAPGGSVLDLCCGAGASAIPAAHAVGPEGRVLGIDLAAPLLDIGRSRAIRERLANIEFRLADAIRTGLPDSSFDAVVCVFGVFFAPDMPAFVAEMWRLVRPGGTLAITTWGPGWCEPASRVFWDAVRVVEPALHKAFNPWDEITTAELLSALLTRGGVERAVAELLPAQHRLDRPDDFWDIVMGSGLRRTVDGLSAAHHARLRGRVLEALRATQITRLRNDVVFGTAVRV